MLIELQKLFIASVYKKDSENFKTLITSLKNITDNELKITLMHGLLDTFIQILLAWPSDEYLVFQEELYLLFVDIVNNLKDSVLDTRLFAAMAKIGSGKSINPSFIGLWTIYLSKRWANFQNMPLTHDVLESIIWFYKVIDQLKQNPNNNLAENVGYTNRQKSLLARIISEFAVAKNSTSLEVLCTLNETDEKIKDIAPVNEVLQQLFLQPDGRAAYEKTKKDFHSKSRFGRQSSLLLTSWLVLQPDQRNQLLSIYQKLFQPNLVNIRNEPAPNTIKSSASLAQRIGKLIIAAKVERGGVWVAGKFESKEEADNTASFLNSLNKNDSASTPLADTIDFAFIANSIEGVQIGSDKHLLNEAIRLAETYLSEKEKVISKSQTTSNVQLMQGLTDSPISPSRQRAVTSPQIDPRWITSGRHEAQGFNCYKVEINYPYFDLNSPQEKELQDMLEGKLGLRSTSAIVNIALPITRTPNAFNYIKVLYFDSDIAAQKLVNAATKFISDNNESESLSLPVLGKQ